MYNENNKVPRTEPWGGGGGGANRSLQTSNKVEPFFY